MATYPCQGHGCGELGGTLLSSETATPSLLRTESPPPDQWGPAVTSWAAGWVQSWADVLTGANPRTPGLTALGAPEHSRRYWRSLAEKGSGFSDCQKVSAPAGAPAIGFTWHALPSPDSWQGLSCLGVGLTSSKSHVSPCTPAPARLGLLPCGFTGPLNFLWPNPYHPVLSCPFPPRPCDHILLSLTPQLLAK